MNTQMTAPYKSSENCRELFSRIIDTPAKKNHGSILKAAWLETYLGPMIAIADEAALYCLEFMDCKDFEYGIMRIKKKTASTLLPGTSQPIESIKQELTEYFSGKLIQFKTPLKTLGSPFQHHVWKALQHIPAGETRSYLDIAKTIGNPKAFRAVALANAANPLAIIIPCHRVINTNGALGGYAAGVTRKQWLIAHEKQIKR